jgi:hypothetical protein
MSLMTMLSAAQGGGLFARVARSLDLDEDETRKAMGVLCPAIARQLKIKAQKDEDLFQSLLDLIEDDDGMAPLETPESLTDADAVADGNAILGDIYGSRNAAMVALRKVAEQVPERELAKLAPISATAVVAALAQANRARTGQPMPLTTAQPAANSSNGESGIIGSIIGAVISGAVQGVVRELTSARRRSSTSYTKSRSRKKSGKSKRTTSTQKRRTNSVSIEDIFRDILGKAIT